jgi:hypothetical protein
MFFGILSRVLLVTAAFLNSQIVGLLGHSAWGVTQGYAHLDMALIVAASDVAAAIV